MTRRRLTLLTAAALLIGILITVALLPRNREQKRVVVPTPTPPGERFVTLAPGVELPTGERCAQAVRGSGWEPRPANSGPNNTPGIRGVRIDGANATGNARFAPRIDGNFTGTTDEIIRWGACKWGFDEDIVRAVAIQESFWRQSFTGDYIDGSPQSFGLLQVKRTVHKGTYPSSQLSTAFNVDYALAWRRSCFEGYFSDWIPASAVGDEWGCVGLWYSGNWKDQAGLKYTAEVQEHLRDRVWLRRGF